jgi:ribosomal protein S18 acetylase RimI-like enzyme
VVALRERGVVSVTGGVGPKNVAARSFYENAGFQTVELRLVADVEVLEGRLAEPAGRRRRQ